MTRKEEAENYIIQKYRINENYRVDNEETRAYMRDDVHSDYQQEYELYLFGLNNGFDKGYHRQRERCDEEMKDLRNQFVLDGERIKQLGIENEALKQSVEEGEEIIAELKEQNKDLCESLDIMNNRESDLLAQIEKMKNFVESMYEANKKDAYCKEYLGTILNEWS